MQYVNGTGALTCEGSKELEGRQQTTELERIKDYFKIGQKIKVILTSKYGVKKIVYGTIKQKMDYFIVLKTGCYRQCIAYTDFYCKIAELRR